MLDDINSPEDLKKLSIEQLPELAEHLRKSILQCVSETGGHLASSLGVVELTIALHYVYNSPIDKIVWDVGHQAYVHKMLTGRRKHFNTLRQFCGMSGFPKMSESEHDAFGVGHASTSISSALGIANANKDINIIAVIGDGALTGGIAMEGINQLGYLQSNMLIILNDNEMSIAPNVGALAEQTKRVKNTESYQDMRNDYYKIYEDIRPELKPKFENMKQLIKKAVLSPGLVFEKLGINYYGPISGHDINKLIQTLTKLKAVPGPKLLHIITKKGKGYSYAENDAEKFHGVSSFNLKNGQKNGSSKNPSYTSVFSSTMLKLAEENKNIVAITAAMPLGTGLDKFAERFPDRFYDVGIAEQHAVTFAAGLATQGMKPVVTIYSTFLQRSYDQIVHDVCLQNLPVTFAMDRAGLVGNDGPTHHGTFDISYLRHIPNLIFMAPKDENELQHMLKTATNFPGPAAIRYPRGEGTGVQLEQPKTLEIGKAEIVRHGNNTLIIALGTMVQPALEAAEEINATVVNARFIKPLDEDLIYTLASQHSTVLTIEENAEQGGFGSAVLEFLNKKKLNRNIKILAIPDKFIEHGSMKELRKKCNLTKEGILNTLREL